MTGRLDWDPALLRRSTADAAAPRDELLRNQYFVPYLPVTAIRRDQHDYYVCGHQYAADVLEALEATRDGDSVYLTGLHFMRDFGLKRPGPFPATRPWAVGDPVEVQPDPSSRGAGGAPRRAQVAAVQPDLIHYRVRYEDGSSELRSAATLRDPPGAPPGDDDPRSYTRWYLGNVLKRMGERGVKVFLLVNQFWNDEFFIRMRITAPEELDLGAALALLGDHQDVPAWAEGFHVPCPEIAAALRGAGVAVDAARATGRVVSPFASALLDRGLGLLADEIAEAAAPVGAYGIGMAKVKIFYTGGLIEYITESYKLFNWLADTPNIVCRTAQHPSEVMHSHHQKTIVIPGKVVFYGGIDLTHVDGDRWDVEPNHDCPRRHHYTRALRFWHDIGARVRNPDVIKYFVENIRARWHGAHRNGRLHWLEGLRTKDAVRAHLRARRSSELEMRKAERWLQTKTDPLAPADTVVISHRVDRRRAPDEVGLPEPRLPDIRDGDITPTSLTYPIDIYEQRGRANGQGPPFIQVCRSMPETEYQAPPWNHARKPSDPDFTAKARYNATRHPSLRAWNLQASNAHYFGNEWESSSKEAYLVGLRLAKRYVYLENQWVSDLDLMDELVAVARRRERDDDFRMMIVQPTFPLGAANYGIKNTLPGVACTQQEYMKAIARYLGPRRAGAPERFGVFSIDQPYFPYARATYDQAVSRLFEALRGYAGSGDRTELVHRVEVALDELNRMFLEIAEDASNWALGKYYSELHPSFLELGPLGELLDAIEQTYMHPLAPGQRGVMARMPAFLERLRAESDYLLRLCAGARATSPGFFKDGHSVASLVDGLRAKIQAFPGRWAEVYIHSKILIVDDVWAVCGSANAGGISFHGAVTPTRPDTEVSSIIVDDGEQALPKRLVQSIWRAFLGREGLDHVAASAAFHEQAAKRLARTDPNARGAATDRAVAYHVLDPRRQDERRDLSSTTGQNPPPAEAKLGFEVESWSYDYERGGPEDRVVVHLKLRRNVLKDLYLEFWEYDGPAVWQTMPLHSVEGGRLHVPVPEGNPLQVSFAVPRTLDVQDALSIYPGKGARMLAQQLIDAHETDGESGDEALWRYLEGQQQVERQLLPDGSVPYVDQAGSFLEGDELEVSFAIHASQLGDGGANDVSFAAQELATTAEGLANVVTPLPVKLPFAMLRIPRAYFVPITGEGERAVFEVRSCTIARDGFATLELERTNLQRVWVELWDADRLSLDERMPFLWGERGRIRVSLEGRQGGGSVRFLLPPSVDVTEARERELSALRVYLKVFTDATRRLPVYISEPGSIPLEFFDDPGAIEMRTFEASPRLIAGNVKAPIWAASFYREPGRPAVYAFRYAWQVKIDPGEQRFLVVASRRLSFIEAEGRWEDLTGFDTQAVWQPAGWPLVPGPGGPDPDSLSLYAARARPDWDETWSKLWHGPKPAFPVPDPERSEPPGPYLHALAILGADGQPVAELSAGEDAALKVRLHVKGFGATEQASLKLTAGRFGTAPLGAANAQAIALGPIQGDLQTGATIECSLTVPRIDFQAHPEALTAGGWLEVTAEHVIEVAPHRVGGQPTQVVARRAARVSVVGAARGITIQPPEGTERSRDGVIWTEDALDRWPELRLEARAQDAQARDLGPLPVVWELAELPLGAPLSQPSSLELTPTLALALSGPWTWSTEGAASAGPSAQGAQPPAPSRDRRIVVRASFGRLPVATLEVVARRAAKSLAFFRRGGEAAPERVEPTHELPIGEASIVLEAHGLRADGSDLGRVPVEWTLPEPGGDRFTVLQTSPLAALLGRGETSRPLSGSVRARYLDLEASLELTMAGRDGKLLFKARGGGADAEHSEPTGELPAILGPVDLRPGWYAVEWASARHLVFDGMIRDHEAGSGVDMAWAPAPTRELGYELHAGPTALGRFRVQFQGGEQRPVIVYYATDARHRPAGVRVFRRGPRGRRAEWAELGAEPFLLHHRRDELEVEARAVDATGRAICPVPVVWDVAEPQVEVRLPVERTQPSERCRLRIAPERRPLVTSLTATFGDLRSPQYVIQAPRTELGFLALQRWREDLSPAPVLDSSHAPTVALQTEPTGTTAEVAPEALTLAPNSTYEVLVSAAARNPVRLVRVQGLAAGRWADLPGAILERAAPLPLFRTGDVNSSIPEFRVQVELRGGLNVRLGYRLSS